MDASTSVEVFTRQFGSDISGLPVKDVLAAVMSFYANCPGDGLVEENGDGLLFQYGAYDWGSGLHFEIDLTRQFIEVERDDDHDVMSQFHLTCLYTPTDALTTVGSGTRWCWSRANLPAFLAWVMAHPVIAAVDRLPILRAEIEWWLV